MELPQGTVTLLLTDVEDSSRAWQERPEQTAETIAAIERLAKEVVGAHGGRVVKSRGEGDSTFSVFTSASIALEAAVALQLALRSLPLRVRMGLHTGDVVLRDGDYYGLTPAKCARVRAVAVGGQILCSYATTAVSTDLPRPITLRDLGTVHLRSFPEPERISQVCHPDLPDDFATIGPHDTLPAGLTSFVGREHMQKEVLDALKRERLVTLTGAGGCGKSRLAVEAVRRLDSFGGGVWFVDLSPVHDPADVPKRVAAALGIPPATDVEASVREFLSGEASLVILDNCEHQVDAVARLSQDLLQHCRSVRLVATSREPLGIPGEGVVRVPSLTDEEAAQLFADRARAASPGFALDEHAQEAVTEICRRLDGIPLAIELAAARTSALGIADLMSGLEDRFMLLTSGGRTALSRQRTLEASVDWSYDLLTDEERSLLRALSVFVDTFSLDAVKAVTGDDRAVDSLSSLVAKSLVQPVEVLWLPRYRLLDTIRHYAQRKLVDSDEQPDSLDAHYRYYSTLTGELFEGLWGGDRDKNWAARTTEAELANIRAAAEYASTTGDAAGALALVKPLWITALDPRQSEKEWVTSLLEAAVDAPAEDRFAAYFYLGSLEMNMGDPAVLQTFADSAATRAALTEPSAMAFAASWEGAMHAFASIARGREDFDRAEQLAGGEPIAVSTVAYMRALIELRAGDHAAAVALTESAVAQAAAFGNRTIHAIALSIAAEANLDVGQFDRADALLAEAASLTEFVPPRYLVVLRLMKLELAMLAGDIEAAGSLLAESRQMARAHPLTRSAEAHNRCKLAAWTGDFTEALGALPDAAGPGIRPRLRALDQVEIALAGGRPNLAEDLVAAEERLAAFGDADTRTDVRAGALVARARLAIEAGAFDAAVDAARDALAALETCGVMVGGPDALRIHALASAGAGDLQRGVRLAAAGEAMRSAMGAVAPPYRVSISHLVEQADDWSAGAAMSWPEAVAYARRGRGSRKRPSAGWGSLTPTEAEVVGLVVDGLRNKEVAERLFMSVPTVKSHLTHVFAKLGLSSRAELIAAAARRPSDQATSPPTSA